MASLIITCNTNPDLDRFACAFAYQEFLSKTGQEAAMVIFGAPHEEVNYLLNRFNIVFPQNNVNELSPASQIVLVDTSDLRGLDKKINPEKVIEVIDHRQINDQHLFPKAKIQIELVGACATLMAERYRQQGLMPSLQSAILIYGAIVSNTLNFKANTTTERDRAVANWLVENFDLPENLAQEMFLAKSDLGGKR
ncbi:MAG: DHH family phosphoesterase, partial [Patescibacteria group bacterium]